jgi:hypothetical protein
MIEGVVLRIYGYKSVIGQELGKRGSKGEVGVK